MNDVSDYLETYTADDLTAKIGSDWFYTKYEPEYIEA